MARTPGGRNLLQEPGSREQQTLSFTGFGDLLRRLGALRPAPLSKRLGLLIFDGFALPATCH